MSHQSDLCSQTEAICWAIAAPNQFNIFRRKGIMPNDRGFLDRRIEQAPALVSGQKSASCHFALPLRRITKLTPKRLALAGGHSLPVDPRTITRRSKTVWRHPYQTFVPPVCGLDRKSTRLNSSQ